MRAVRGAAEPPRGGDRADPERRRRSGARSGTTARPATPGTARARRGRASGSRTSAGRARAPCTIPHARGTMLCSSGLSSPPNGRPYWIPTSRSAAASAEQRLTSERSAAQTSGGAPPTRCGDFVVGDEHRVDAGALERDDVLAGRGLEIGDRELAGRHVGEQVEDPLEVVLVVLRVARREQEDLRVDPLERRLERLLVVDVGDDLEAELASPLRAAPRGRPRRRAPRRRSGRRRRRLRSRASGGGVAAEEDREAASRRGRRRPAALSARPSAPCSSAARAPSASRRAR